MKRVPPRPPTQYELNQSPLPDEQEKEPQQVVRKFDFTLVADHLKKELGVKKLTKSDKRQGRVPVSLFPKEGVSCQSLAEHNELKLEFCYSGPVSPSGQFLSLSSSKILKGNFTKDTKVTIWGCCCRQYDNSQNDVPIGVSFNLMNDHKAYEAVDKDFMELQQSLGVLPHTFMTMKPKTSEEKDYYGLKPQSVKHNNGAELKYHSNNPDFITSTYRIHGNPLYGVYTGKEKHESTQDEIDARQNDTIDKNEPQTLWNGIIYIPSNICDKVGLPLYDQKRVDEAFLNQKLRRMQINTEEQTNINVNEITEEDRKQSALLNCPDDGRIRCWYAIDPNHVLSWSLRTSYSERIRMGIMCQNFPIVVNKKRIEAAYLVPDATLRFLMRDYNKNFDDKVDIRKGNWYDTVGFYIAPITDQKETVQVKDVKFRVTLKFIEWKEPPVGSKINPVLHPTFTDYNAFNKIIKK